MKKVALIGFVIILLAVSVVPVMASNGGSNGQGNGHGNGVGVGQTNNKGDRDQTRDQDQVRLHTSVGNANRGAHGNLFSMGMRTPFYLQGTITDVGPNTLTVDVFHGNARVKQFIGTTLTVQTTANTLIYELTQGGDDNNLTPGDDSGNKVIIPLASLEIGRKVAIHGNLVDTVYTARLITEYIRTSLGETTGTP